MNWPSEALQKFRNPNEVPSIKDALLRTGGRSIDKDRMKALDEAWNARDKIDSLLDQFEQPVAGESSEYNILCTNMCTLYPSSVLLKDTTSRLGMIHLLENKASLLSTWSLCKLASSIQHMHLCISQITTLGYLLMRCEHIVANVPRAVACVNTNLVAC